jgi:hypothetical protein
MKAKEAAKEWWDENGKVVVTDAATAAKDYWDSKKGEIVAEAKEIAQQVGDKALAEARAYVDTKLAEQRQATVRKLLDSGVKFGEIDTDGDGSITDAELEAYLKTNPMALWYGGAALAGWWALWQLRKRMGNVGTTPATKAPATNSD